MNQGLSKLAILYDFAITINNHNAVYAEIVEWNVWLLHQLSRFSGIAVTSSSGIALKISSDKKWPGISAVKSNEFDDNRLIRHKLRITLIWKSTLCATSSALNKCNFIDFTSASQCPPKCSERAEIKCHRVLLTDGKYWSFSCCSANKKRLFNSESR